MECGKYRAIMAILTAAIAVMFAYLDAGFTTWDLADRSYNK